MPPIFIKISKLFNGNLHIELISSVPFKCSAVSLHSIDTHFDASTTDFHEQFLLFPQCFQKQSVVDLLKGVSME